MADDIVVSEPTGAGPGLPWATTPSGKAIYYADGELTTLDHAAGVLSASDPARWMQKADAFSQAWIEKFGVAPSTWAVALGLAVAQHETLCGDAWPGEYNWGACQRADGFLTLADRAALATAHIVATPRNVAAARQCLSAAGLSRKNAALHCDSSPVTGWYFVYFWEFVSDEGGAELFERVLCADRPKCKAVLDHAVGAFQADCYALAATMYASHYYEGFHAPNSQVKLPDGRVVDGATANILDYSGSLYRIAPAVFDVLTKAGWSPTPGKPQFDLTKVAGYQSALVYLASKLGRADMNPGKIDGIYGPHTKAAIDAFQKYVAIGVSGIFDAPTQAAMQAALDIQPPQ